MNNVLAYVALMPLVLVSVSWHECAHAFVAFLCGDRTAQQQGRLTLNPLAHVDIMGMVIVPLISMAILSFPFGWAKPVPINPMMLRHPKRDMTMVALAGPVSNLLLASLGMVLLKQGFWPESSLMAAVCFVFMSMNLALAVFNFLPLPPLDGSKILSGFLPRRQAMALARLEPYGFWILLALLWTGLAGQWVRAGRDIFLKLWGL